MNENFIDKNLSGEVLCKKSNFHASPRTVGDKCFFLKDHVYSYMVSSDYDGIIKVTNNNGHVYFGFYDFSEHFYYKDCDIRRKKLERLNNV